jgi:hypothetical protein
MDINNSTSTNDSLIPTNGTGPAIGCPNFTRRFTTYK